MHFDIRQILKFVLIFPFLSGCGGTQMRTVTPFGVLVGGFHRIALRPVWIASDRFIRELDHCLIENTASVKNLDTEELHISLVFRFAREDSEILEFYALRKSDDSNSKKTIELCLKSAADIASAFFLSEVIKEDDKSSFGDFRGKYYMDGTLRPSLSVVVSDERMEKENRAILLRGNNRKK